uniref:Uncharacterized protein n=1 Tax=Setaria viridis TaxID=4556 RepID=A0A4U6U705_SETVI|nr:hypothetical protein SEVIR_6G235850v2 [Setaria viridis]
MARAGYNAAAHRPLLQPPVEPHKDARVKVSNSIKGVVSHSGLSKSKYMAVKFPRKYSAGPDSLLLLKYCRA